MSKLPNDFLANYWKDNQFGFLNGLKLLKSELVFSNHRTDFLSSFNKNCVYLDAKSVTLVKSSLAEFPNAFTKRGFKHVKFP
tara:strand:+ start:276 stop:521 length:246 start_codon:yes stop_codon:yes gene_type:complete